VAHIWIYDGAGNILCQQRSLQKDTNPGYWEGFFGGHIAPETDPSLAAAQELEEELGISVEASELNLELVYQYHSPSGKNNEFQYVYSYGWSGAVSALALEEDEVQQVCWQTIKQVRDGVGGQSQDDWTVLGYEEEVLEGLATGAE
jgi:isopentenyldiphosphate isomerase